MQAEGGTRSLAEEAAAAFTAYRDGHPDAMGKLVDALTPLLWHTARAQGLGAAQAEDVVQNTWLQLLQHQHGITDPGGVLKWLLTTTRREAWASSRKTRREDFREDLTDAGEPAGSGSDETLEVVLRSQDQGLLWRHFKDLPERCQALLRVIALAERPDYAQVAQALGMPVGSIGPTRGRCLAKLRNALVGDPGWAA
ncbi:MAG TPA: sigma-70 family RNA polymerase sigma factor [Pedococcus sp.]|nr:sigma-70 family RNA polymerase sigma factor [Pedococcus sp.]